MAGACSRVWAHGSAPHSITRINLSLGRTTVRPYVNVFSLCFPWARATIALRKPSTEKGVRDAFARHVPARGTARRLHVALCRLAYSDRHVDPVAAPDPHAAPGASGNAISGGDATANDAKRLWI